MKDEVVRKSVSEREERLKLKKNKVVSKSVGKRRRSKIKWRR